jgi:hypothetical protein
VGYFCKHRIQLPHVLLVPLFACFWFPLAPPRKEINTIMEIVTATLNDRNNSVAMKTKLVLYNDH